MCFSYEASVLTGLFSWSVCIYLWGRGGLTTKQSQDVMFLFLFSAMQWLDAVLWRIKMRRNTVNYVVSSYFIPAVLVSQIAHNMFIVQGVHRKSMELTVAICLYMLFFFYYYRGYSVASNNFFGSPIWAGKEISFSFGFLFLVVIMYGRIGFEPEKRLFTITSILILVIPFLFSGGFGSLWCAFANVYALHLLCTV